MDLFPSLVSSFTKTPLSVLAFTLGIYVLLVAGGIATGFKFGDVLVPAPQKRRSRIIVATVGFLLIIVSVKIAYDEPIYKTKVEGRRIHAIINTDTPQQVIADGEDVYLLYVSGNIYRVLGSELQRVDNGTNTRQIVSAGGVLYVLKESGQIWAVSVASKSVAPAFEYKIIDDGAKTQQIGTESQKSIQIAPAGEALYILKEKGNIWKYVVYPVRGENDRGQSDRFTLVDDGTDTRAITSSGSILYVLKNDGTIWQYVSSIADHFFRIYPSEGNLTDDGEKPEIIKADGGTLYFIKHNGSTWSYRRGLELIKGGSFRTNRIDALGGILYLLTSEGEGTIWRFNAKTKNLKRWDEAGMDNVDFTAYGQELFVIKKTGQVWRYSETVLGR